MHELERRELQRPGRQKREGQLGGAEFSAWLGEWRRRQLAGERIAVLVNYPHATHVVVVELEEGEPNPWASSST